MVDNGELTLPKPVAERLRRLGDGEVARRGEFVLYWMRTAVRGHENPALDAALLAGNALGKRVLVVSVLEESEPYASDRFHTFALEGLRDAAQELIERGVAFALHVERPGHRGRHLEELAARAAIVVTEDMPVAPYCQAAERLARQTSTALWCVDTACVLPMLLVNRPYDRAFLFRQATGRLREARLPRAWSDARPALAPESPPLPFEPVSVRDADIASLVAECDIDHGVGPVPHTRGGSRAGYQRWSAFRAGGLDRYARDRNDPLRDGVSRMSPYLHAGHVSPFRLARDASQHGGSGAEKFLDELLIWRELAYVYCAWHRDHDRVATLPEWAQQTLNDHRADPRPAEHCWETLARGRTGDALWDAAQQSLLIHGELHNNVRMTWGKALLEWTPSAEGALERLVDLNHRYALDGRDPSSFGGILWCLGQFDRPFSPEIPILGTIRPRPTRSHGRRLDAEAYAQRTSRPATSRPLQVDVIGAGIAGLVAARTLADHGHSVVVFDKGREPGGRASSRRRGGFAFDHGAQYFTARDARFRRHVDAWLERGVAALWTPRLVVFDEDGVRGSQAEHERYVGLPGMNAVAAHLASDLDVHSSVRVARLERNDSVWQVRDDSGELLTEAEVVLVAVPPAQAAPLLAAAPRLQERVSAGALRPCWAVLLGFESPVPVEFDAAFLEVGSLSWIARNTSKPGRGGGEAWVLHASVAWSEQNLECDAAEVTRLLKAEFISRCVGSQPPAVSYADAHRWRYARPDPVLEAPCLFDDDLRVGVAGDWCGSSRIENAFLSGMALAGRILGRAAEFTAEESGP
jgi:photolyase PhrII